jgi:aminopeptidase N
VLSLSPDFKTLTTSTASGVEVTLYYLGPAGADSLDTPRHALDVAVDAVTLFEELYGPYPHTRLVVVEGDFPDGMEFSGLVFVSEAWFRTWQGLPNEWLTMITVHEVAHQWWYDLVGSDQGRYPYLDEALAIYSEELFFERYHPDLVQWWWDYRISTYSPTGYVDTSVYDFQDVRPYINAVYLRGALFMAALRSDLGDETFFAWLQQYASRMAGQIASPLDFWGLLSEADYLRTQATRAAYMHQANLLPRADLIP